MKPSAHDGMRIAVGIATAGRSAILAQTLSELALQTRAPDVVLICPAAPDDVALDTVAALPFAVEIIEGGRGLPRQRNAILRAACDCDVLVYFDDDFFPEPHYLATVERLMRDAPDVVVATGELIADGIKGPGLEPAEARALLAAAAAEHPREPSLRPDYNAYGCNMVVRLAPALRHGIAFDEALPLYGWQEDVDFSRRLACYGRVVRASALTGVHLGTKRGRTSGVKFGYSQIANPIYLIRKGTMSSARAGQLMLRNIIANFARLPRPEAWVDRAGRCRGNLMALVDLTRGRLHPLRVLDLD